MERDLCETASHPPLSWLHTSRSCEPPYRRGECDPPSVEIERLAKRLVQDARRYRADWKVSLSQLTITGILFAVLLTSMYVVLSFSFWLMILLAIPTAGLLVRLFIFQHDCGHGSFFASRVANDVIGRLLGVLTLTPYAAWQKDHAAHHASTGNLDRRGHGDVTTLTVVEYMSLSKSKRLSYRLYRNPLIMVLLGAPINFIVLQRIAVGQSFRNRGAWRSILFLNVGLTMVFGVTIAMIGVASVVTIYLPVMIIASWMGNWLFYVQHQFEGAYWQRDESWKFHIAALCGSSFFKLPPILRWFSGNIGLHHVHHLCSRIPNYRLQACLDANPEIQLFTKTVGLRESLTCWRFALWDEDSRVLVRFADVR